MIRSNRLEELKNPTKKTESNAIIQVPIKSSEVITNRVEYDWDTIDVEEFINLQD